VDQRAILQAMGDPAFYPDAPSAVTVRETHISTLFLTDEYVYKVKKPVDFGFLDFTTLSARHFFCEQEVRLNRRLSPGVYLGVVAIHQSERGITLEPPGDVVEYAVKMRRIPEARMMDVLLARGKIDAGIIRQIALQLVGFHSRARTDQEISLYGTVARVAKNTEENFRQTEEFIGRTLSRDQFDRITAFTRHFLEARRPLFRRRVAEKRIRDCHGDIRMEHICIVDPIVIFDCIEFNRRFRYTDVAADLAFLAMDLDFHDRPPFSRALVKTYVEYSQDVELLKVIRFYKCYRAYVRGKVESFQGADSVLPDAAREKHLSRARRYFALADTYAQARSYLVITSGLTGTGKSKLADALARDLDMALFQSDRIRKEISGVPAEEHRLEPFGKGIYSQETSRRTYQTLLAKAEEALHQGRPVILDATYLKQGQRNAVQELAEKFPVPFFVIEVTCPEEEVKKRLSNRIREPGAISDGRWEIYLSQKNVQEPITRIVSERHLVIDASGKEDLLSEIVKKILITVET
jgi:aminoglycoside phosphotransferase family enzyme/gluconate kinase